MLAYEPNRLNTFVVSRHSMIEKHHFGDVRFVDCSWYRVFRLSSAPKADCRPRQPFVLWFAAGYSRHCDCFWHRYGFGFLLFPEGPPDASAQSLVNPFNSRSNEGTEADTIVSDGIVDAPLVFGVAVHLYWWGSAPIQ